MAIDPNDPRLRRVLLSDEPVAQATLATRIVLTRLRGEVRASASALPQKLRELADYLSKNRFAQGDAAYF